MIKNIIARRSRLGSGRIIGRANSVLHTQAVKRRDGYLCQVCVRGLYHPERRYETEGLEVHHIQTVASCYEKRLDGYNLLTLCERHHKMADAGKIPAKELQMIAAEQEEK